MIHISSFLYGLDLSILCTGVVILDTDTLQPVHIGSIKTNAKNEHGKRLHNIREYIKSLMLKYPPSEISIERGFTMHNSATQVLYRVHGVANELMHKYEQFYYPPATVKKAITDNGRANKDLVKEELLKRYPGIQFKNEDESDAFAVAMCHLIKKHKVDW